jgi:histone deacetylase complex regulatory component SIN3
MALLILSVLAEKRLINWSLSKREKFARRFDHAVEENYEDDAVEGDKKTYQQFLGVAADFKQQLIDIPGLVERVKVLLDGEWGLLRTFAWMLPADYASRLEEEVLVKQEAEAAERERVRILKAPRETMTQETANEFVERALAYVRKVRTKYSELNQVHVYHAFLGALNMLKSGEKSYAEVQSKVASLFEAENPELLEEFRMLLPVALSSTGSGVDLQGIT